MNEVGVVTLDKLTPVVGIPVTASLTDPDGGISKLTWQWSITDADAGMVDGVTETSNGRHHRRHVGHLQAGCRRRGRQS